MTTTVTITGSGTPLYEPGRAGPGVLVQAGSAGIQVDAGRATALRLAEAGVALGDLAGVLVTHHHSDHLVGLPDLVMTRWLEADPAGVAPLPVVVPDGPGADIVERMLDVWGPEMDMRAEHTGRSGVARVDVRRFQAAPAAMEVFATGETTVHAVAVRHEPVVPAVAYRITTASATVVVSGDTAVCPEVETLAKGADVLVHEALRRSAISPGMLSDPEAIVAYHADTVELGAMAARAGVDTLLLTHLIPPPRSPDDVAGFEEDIRAGGFTGAVVVAQDLATVTVG